MLSVQDYDPKTGLTVGSGGSGATLSGVAPTTGGYANYVPTTTQSGYVATWGAPQSSETDVAGTNNTNYSAPAYDAGDLAYLDEQLGILNNQFGRTDTTLKTGLAQILQDYNSKLADSNKQQSRFSSDLALKQQDTERGRETAIGKVDTNARTLANSLRLRLGMAGGADSSAYNITAPGAVARQATEERTGVLENYGVNLRDLAERKKRGDEDFAELLKDLAAQKAKSETNFRSSIEEKRNEIDLSRAQLAREKALLLGGGYTEARNASQPYVNQISARDAAIDKMLGNIRTINPGKVDISMPNLRDYMVDRAAINANNEAGTQDPYAPYRPNLEEEENVNVLV